MNAPKIQDDEASIFKRATLILNEFPMDTLIHIQSFMFPLDIIALRQVCLLKLSASLCSRLPLKCSKLMASATSHRTVWLDALRRICATHEVSVLTYPMENMTLRELEHAATSPAFSTRLFQPRLPRSTTGNVGETLMLRLIPGGRYLVMAGELARISVWDLGYGPAAVINPYPLASIILPFATHRLLIQPTKNKQGFRILTISNQAINNVVDVTVYEIYPAAANPTFQQFAHRRVFNTPDIEAFAFTPDRFTYYCNFLLTMWDFVQDTSATVHVYQPLMSITVSRTAVIGRHENGIVVVEIPPLHPRGTPAAEVVVEPITLLPMFSHIHDVFSEFTELHTIQADWHTCPDVPVILDVFGRLVDGWDAYARCVIKEVPGGDPDLPSALPVLMGVTRVPGETWDAEYYGRLHFSKTHLVRTWPTGAALMINSARVPTRRQIEFESKTAHLWKMPKEAEDFLYDLDPMSGRFVALAGPTIRVLDYMLPYV